MSAMKRTDDQIKQDKSDKIMEIVIERAAYYRANPQRFVKEFLNITLKLFQKILLWCMMNYDAFYFVACRGNIIAPPHRNMWATRGENR